MHSFKLSYLGSSIQCRVYGQGPQLVLAFHGYGESAEHFSFLEPVIGGTHTLLAIDLPFHGHTEWHQGLHFTPADLEQIVLQAIDLLPRSYSAPFTLLGFSLGGRMALQLYQQQPDLFSRILLLAPDGLKINNWYWLATQTWLGNRVFAFTMKNPGWFFALLRGLNKLKLVNTSIFKFVQFYIGNQQVRQQLYQRWTALRKIKPSLPHIRQSVISRHTRVQLVYGRYDRIILPQRGEKFRKGIEAFCELEVVEAGHQLLQERHAALIADRLYH